MLHVVRAGLVGGYEEEVVEDIHALPAPQAKKAKKLGFVVEP